MAAILPIPNSATIDPDAEPDIFVLFDSLKAATTDRYEKNVANEAAVLALSAAFVNQKVATDTGVVYRFGPPPGGGSAAWRAWESDWISYTSTRTGITLGTSQSFNTRYRYVNGEVEVEYFTRVTSGGDFSGPTLTTPTPISLAFTFSTQYLPFDGDGSYYVVGGGAIWRGGVLQDPTSPTTRVVLGYQDATTKWNILSGSAPSTLSAGNIVRGTFRYQPA